MLVITLNSLSKELKWVLHVVLSEFMSVPYRIVLDDTQSEKYIQFMYEERTLLVRQIFLLNKNSWFTVSSLPILPLQAWTPNYKGSLLSANILPVLFGSPEVEEIDNDIVRVEIDIFGTIFFMLSGYEELANPKRNKYGNFSAYESISYKAGYLNRPVVDEYVKVLSELLKKFFSEEVFREHKEQHNIYVSCDADHPLHCKGYKFPHILRPVAGDLLRRRSLKLAYQRLLNYWYSTTDPAYDFRLDPNNTFRWYMDVCEAANLKAAFYFISGHSAGRIDGCYNVENPYILALFKQINERGHEIGLHPSYNSFRDEKQLKCEYDTLSRALSMVSPSLSIKGTRQHYLRWDVSCTPDYLDSLGVDYDTTGGFADHPGFRYGTAREFTMWGWKEQRVLRLKQRPLIVMEASLFAKEFLNLKVEDAFDLIMDFKRRALEYGNFTLLWHNNNLLKEQEKDLFKSILSNV